jgi:hypothetical protein
MICCSVKARGEPCMQRSQAKAAAAAAWSKKKGAGDLTLRVGSKLFRGIRMDKSAIRLRGGFTRDVRRDTGRGHVGDSDLELDRPVCHVYLEVHYEHLHRTLVHQVQGVYVLSHGRAPWHACIRI